MNCGGAHIRKCLTHSRPSLRLDRLTPDSCTLPPVTNSEEDRSPFFRAAEGVPFRKCITHSRPNFSFGRLKRRRQLGYRFSSTIRCRQSLRRNSLARLAHRNSPDTHLPSACHRPWHRSHQACNVQSLVTRPVILCYKLVNSDS
jgi:hypothetical protein